MGLADIIILAAIGVAFVAVCVRVKRKGTCGDCPSGGGCSGKCSGGCDAEHRKGCAALKGVDAVTEKLSRGVR